MAEDAQAIVGHVSPTLEIAETGAGAGVSEAEVTEVFDVEEVAGKLTAERAK